MLVEGSSDPCFAADANRDALVGRPSILQKLGKILMESNASANLVAEIFCNLTLKGD